MKAIQQSSDPRLSALKLTYSTTKLFRLLGMRMKQELLLFSMLGLINVSYELKKTGNGFWK